tara:strand:+ start:3755 stop:4693 length:939 start_codon:yes stop_codon:yes gene_type:complete
MKQLNDLGVDALLYKRWGEVISSIESAFLDDSAKMVPKVYLDSHTHGDFRAMPAALGDYACLKWIGVYPNNHLISSLPTTLGTLLLNERETGKPLMAMDCTTLTAYRTAATSAIAAKHCLPNNIREIAFVGCGLQAYYHFLAYREVFTNIKTVSLYDKNEEAIQKLANKIPKTFNVIKYPSNIEQAIKQADLITTLTPSKEPYLDFNYLKNNCHINAVGADAVGKRELMANVITRASNIICDDPAQAFHSGELQYTFGQDLNTWSLRHVIKNKTEMDLENGVSVFDSTGVSLEDIAIGILVYSLYNISNENT